MMHTDNTDNTNNTDTTVKGGLSLTTVLVIIFAVLKVMGLTTMSWVWVFSPWWISLVFVSTVLLIWVLIFILLGRK